MNRNFKYYLSVWAIMLVLFNAAVFVSPSEALGMSKFGGAFWSGYIFVSLAFIGQLFCAFKAFKAENKAENSRKLFYNLPIITVSFTGLVLTLVFGSVCMIVPDMPNWLGTILCLAVLAFTASVAIKAKLAGDIVSETDDKIKMHTAFVKSFAAEAECLINKAKSEQAKKECKKVYEALRYSDPVSAPVLSEVEREFAEKFKVFSAAVEEDNEAAETAGELLTLIDLRNKKCKLLKQG